MPFAFIETQNTFERIDEEKTKYLTLLIPKYEGFLLKKFNQNLKIKPIPK